MSARSHCMDMDSHELHVLQLHTVTAVVHMTSVQQWLLGMSVVSQQHMHARDDLVYFQSLKSVFWHA